jgi:hypothetical protein
MNFEELSRKKLILRDQPYIIHSVGYSTMPARTIIVPCSLCSHARVHSKEGIVFDDVESICLSFCWLRQRCASTTRREIYIQPWAGPSATLFSPLTHQQTNRKNFQRKKFRFKASVYNSTKPSLWLFFFSSFFFF